MVVQTGDQTVTQIMVLQTTINSYGSSYVAGWTVANKPELLANIPLSATGVPAVLR